MTAYNYSDYTTFAIKNVTERYILAGFNLFILLSSLLGDRTILIASLRYRAFKLHRMITATIQHLAVCDLLFSLTTVLPSAVSMLANRWVFGGVLCQARAHLGYLLAVNAWLLIALQTTSKFLVLKFPMRAATASTRQCHVVCAGTWICALVIPIIYLVVGEGDVLFDYRTYLCIYGFSSEIWGWLKPLLLFFMSSLPNLVVLITTVMLLFEARKVAQRGRENLRWQGIMVVVLTALMHCLSVIPYTIYLIAAPHVQETPPGIFHVHYFRVAACCLLFNVISNFYIYSLTLTSFRMFLKERSTVVSKYLRSQYSASNSGNHANTRV